MSLAGIPESHYRNGDGPSMLGPLGPLGPLAAPSYVAANAATSAFSKNNCEFPTNKPFELSYNAGAPRGRRLSLQWQTSGVSGAPNIQLYLDASRGGNNVPAATTACPPRSGGSSPTTHTPAALALPPCMLRLDGPGQQRQSGSLLHSMLMDEFSFRDCSADGGPVFPMTPTPVDIGIPFLPKQPSGSTVRILTPITRNPDLQRARVEPGTASLIFKHTYDRLAYVWRVLPRGRSLAPSDPAARNRRQAVLEPEEPAGHPRARRRRVPRRGPLHHGQPPQPDEHERDGALADVNAISTALFVSLRKRPWPWPGK